ncbi:hypothetical protein ACIA48_02445 [Mycobacterium sp. NPDC051804]|uniref:hypothetical protein n=1 Tax=Mycobacterium sp. NPDC051804 TaxID=3364295 RepID=UPI0037B7B839
MLSIKTTLTAVAVSGGLTAATLGMGAGLAIAQPPPPPPRPAEAPAPPPPVLGEVPPPNAPPKPTEFWLGEPVVWTSGWGGRWAIFKNGQPLLLSSNIVTGGG